MELWGPHTPQKNLYYSLDRDEKLHTYVKSEIKWGNYQDLFFHFLPRKLVIHRKRKKRGYAVTNRTVETRMVQPTQLIRI